MVLTIPVETLHQIQIVTYVHVCSVALVFYDYLLTLPQEIRLIWSSEWSAVKALFFITRYGALFEGVCILISYSLTHPSTNICGVLNHAADATQMICITAAELIFCFRTWALWGRDKRVAVVLAATSTSLMVVVITILTKFTVSPQFRSDISGLPASLPRCIHVDGTNDLYITYACIVGSETVVFALTMFKAPGRSGLWTSHLYRVLYRDGILYYVAFVVISIVNIVVVLVAPLGIAEVISVLQGMLHAMLATRVVVHLRDAASVGTSATTNGLQTHTLGEMEFTYPPTNNSSEGSKVENDHERRDERRQEQRLSNFNVEFMSDEVNIEMRGIGESRA